MTDRAVLFVRLLSGGWTELWIAVRSNAGAHHRHDPGKFIGAHVKASGGRLKRRARPLSSSMHVKINGRLSGLERLEPAVIGIFYLFCDKFVSLWRNVRDVSRVENLTREWFRPLEDRLVRPGALARQFRDRRAFHPIREQRFAGDP